MSGKTSILEIATSWGPITVQACEGKIVACDIAHAGSSASKPFSIRKVRLQEKGSNKNKSVLKAAETFVRGMFSGRAVTPPSVVIPDGTEFQRKVWRLLYAMKPGQTLSYGEVARKAGFPKAARAAGQACGANPIPLFIPCHRVVAANGRLGGFSCGLAWKELLLNLEDNGKAGKPQARRRSA